MKKLLRAIDSDVVNTGEMVWRAIAPGRRIKTWRNKRRARKGKPLLEFNEEDFNVLPNGTATHTGAGIAAASPFIGFIVAATAQPLENAIIGLGMAPAVCSPEAAGCVTAGMMAVAFATGVLTTIAAWLSSWGRRRAEKRHQAELAAAKAK